MSYEIHIDTAGASLIDENGERILGLAGAPIDCRSVLEALKPNWHCPYRSSALTRLLRQADGVRVCFSSTPMLFEPS